MFAQALISEANQLNSDHPLNWVVELEPGTGPLERLTNEREDITFHGNVYTSRPFLLEQYGEGTAANPVELRATYGDANGFISTLKENYWRGVIHPKWYITLWLVDMTDPDLTPLSAGARFRARMPVINVDQGIGSLTLYDDTVSTTKNAPQRRYTPRDGFPTMRTF